MMHDATLPLLLKQLGLPTMRLTFEEIASEAESAHWTYPQYLACLAGREAAVRQQRRIARQIKEAYLPQGKSLDTLDFNVMKSVNAAKIKALAENTGWVKQADNILIFGASGVGKTHLAAAIGHRLVEQGLRVLFTSAASLVQKLQLARREYRLPDYLNRLAKKDVLILDDIGYVKKDEAETSVLFELIAHRYENRSLIITSNQAFGDWDQIFPDNIMAVAAIDRLVHHADIIHITMEKSYRRTQCEKRTPLLT